MNTLRSYFSTRSRREQPSCYRGLPRSLRRWILLACPLSWLLFLGTSGAPAQSAPVDKHVVLEFTLAGFSSTVTNLAYRQGGKFNRVVVPEYERSPDMKYEGPPLLEFYRLPQTVTPDAPPPPVVASVLLDPAIKKATLLLVPIRGGKYEVVVIPDDIGTFPVGQALLINFTRRNLALRCNGAAPFTLAPREQRFTPGDGRKLDAELAEERNGRWKRIQRNFVPVLPDQQTIIVFIKNPAGGEGFEWIILRQIPKPAELENSPSKTARLVTPTRATAPNVQSL